MANRLTNRLVSRLANKSVWILMLVFLSVSAIANAICSFESIQYSGACPFDGDVYVFDEQGNLIVRQLYSENLGCYNGNYLMQVVGGPEQECMLNPREKVTFKINNQDVGYDVWGMKGQRVSLDLSQTPLVNAQKYEWSDMLLIVGLFGIIIVLYLLLKFARRIVNR